MLFGNVRAVLCAMPSCSAASEALVLGRKLEHAAEREVGHPLFGGASA